ncbi:MAG TPA: four helix bundle protein [Thermomicrobiales bacterium]|nr:four helix bundle protein [Thermomicrobiales bacterium]
MDELTFEDVSSLEEEKTSYRAVVDFEDLIAWQKARELVADIYQISRSHIRPFDRGLSDQMQRAAMSIMANIAEGHERASLREFHRFLTIAKASCAEFRSHLYIAMDVGAIEQAAFQRHSLQAKRVGQLIGGLRASVSRQLAAKDANGRPS